MKSFSSTKLIRSLHRDIGYFVVGLTLIYVLSGIVLVYRDTDFLKIKTEVSKQLDPGLDEATLGQKLKMRRFKVISSEGNIMQFENGTYNRSNGEVHYTEKKLPVIFEKLNDLHKSSSKNAGSVLNVIYAILLGFLAISSFWMFGKKSKLFLRGIILSTAGIIFALVMVFVQG